MEVITIFIVVKKRKGGAKTMVNEVTVLLSYEERYVNIVIVMM